MLELPRYAILARSVFGSLFERFCVSELFGDGVPARLRMVIDGKILDEYADERAGLIDLLHEASWFLDGKELTVSVDFEALKQHELTLPRDPFPRKPRD